jgi:hypothetical protein
MCYTLIAAIFSTIYDVTAHRVNADTPGVNPFDASFNILLFTIQFKYNPSSIFRHASSAYVSDNLEKLT